MTAHFFSLLILVLSALIPFYLYRAVKGPSIFDRLIGLNGIATKAILFLVLIGGYVRQMEMFLDIALGYGLINLVGAVAIGKYLEIRGAGQ
jgi:multicomponent Na+:H+ antiporter subunit F